MTPIKVALIALAAVAGVAITAGAVIAQPTDLPEAAGKDVVQNSCSACHGIDVIVAPKRSPEEWGQIVDRMVGNGAVLSDDQYKTIVTYLTTNLSTTAAVAAAPATPAAH